MRLIPIVLLLAGCATTRLVAIDYAKAPPDDWPILEERTHRITASELAKACGGKPPDRVDSCARMNFTLGVCNIYLTTDDPEASAHERAHCKGYDHVRNNTIHEEWARIKANKR